VEKAVAMRVGVVLAALLACQLARGVQACLLLLLLLLVPWLPLQ
jgi:hypothetical protein